MAKLLVALQLAKSKGIMWPKIRLGRYRFSLAPEHSANAGFMYVKIGETYLGKVDKENVIYSKDMPASVRKEIEAILADPLMAATAYGQRTGTCCICGRTLIAKESVAHSIGPICADKFGFQFSRPSDTMDIPEDF